MKNNYLLKFFFLVVTTIAGCRAGIIPATSIGKYESKVACPGFLQNDPTMPCWTLNGKCYCFSTEKRLDWVKADAFCRNENMRLLTVETYDEDQLIFNQVKSMSRVDYYWTSGKYSNNRWEWASDQPMTYTNWFTGEPSHSQTGSFAYINFNFENKGFWFDGIGSSNYILFICESIDGGTAETTTTSTTTDTLTTATQISTTQTTVKDYTTSRTTVPGAICPYFDPFEGRCHYWNEKCYCFTSKYLLWTEGEELCKSKNMTLLAVETEEEDRMIYQNIKGNGPNYFWAAGRYSPNNNRWEWATYEPFPPMNHTNFYQSQGSYSQPECTLFDVQRNFENGYWNTLPCNITNSHNPVSCEK